MEKLTCTALIQFITNGSEWDRIRIIASDVTMPSETYEGVTRPKTYWPIHPNYSQACKLVKDMTYLVTFTITPEKGQPHPKLTLSEIDPVPNKLEQRRYIRELKEAL